MADIDSIISGAGGNTRAEFPDFAKAFFDASRQRAEFDSRRAFKDGVPTDATGQPDFGAISRTFFQKGDVGQGLAAAKMGIEQQNLQLGRDLAARDFPSGASNPAPSQPNLVSPPSANRIASEVVAPPLNRGGAVSGGGSSPQGDQPGSIVGMVSSAGVPDELAGPIIAQVSAATRTDPNAAINPQIAPRVQQIVAEAVRRQSGGGQPQAPQPQPQAAPVVAAQPVSDPTLGGLVPAGRTPQQQIDLLSRSVASGALRPEVAKMYGDRIKAIQDAIQPTPDMKNAAASGKSLESYQSRSDEAAAQLAILKDSIIPKLDASQKGADAAKDEINAIHRSRSQLDAPGGIFSGSAADVRLKLAKVAEFVGVPNADKIANTEAFGAAIGDRVLSMVKGLGSGTSISNADRAFAERMAGGNITLDEKSIRKILEIGEQAARDKINSHNLRASKLIDSNEALSSYREAYRVDMPGQYKAPKQQAAPSNQFTTFSSPSDVRAAIAAGKLKKGDTFQDANGVTRYVP